MPLTYSGRLVRPSGSVTEIPSILDIAIGMSRQPRFAGQTKRWWSVLDHSMYAADLALMTTAEPQDEYAVLMHDAHEGITTDIPSDFKTDEIRAQQAFLDIGIFERYNVPESEIVHAVDRRALLAEALVIGPPAPKSKIERLFGVADVNDVDYLRSLVERSPSGGYTRPYGLVPYENHQELHPQVKAFIARVLDML